MQRVVFPEQNKVVVESGEIEPPQAGEVQTQTIYSCISPGTELAFLRKLPGVRIAYPYGPGYSNVGRVVALGSDVKDLKVDDVVVTQSSHVAIANRAVEECYPVPDGADHLHASMNTMVGISLQGVRKAELQLGQSVAVIGLGIIGNLAGQLARAAGTTCVVGIDPVGWRQDIAKQCGFDFVCSSSEEAKDLPLSKRVKNADGFDVVIEATGISEPIKQAFSITRRMGRVVLLGSTRGLADGVDFYGAVHHRGLHIVGAHTGIRTTVDEIAPYFTPRTDSLVSLEMLQSGRVDVAPLISDVIKPDDAPRAYERLIARDEQLMTIAIDWQ